MTQNVTDSLEFATWPSGPGRMMSIDLIFDQPLGRVLGTTCLSVRRLSVTHVLWLNRTS